MADIEETQQDELQNGTAAATDAAELENPPTSENQPFLQDSKDGERPNLPAQRLADSNFTGSFASFREDVYSPTTVTTRPIKAGCKEKCGIFFKLCCNRCYARLKPVMWKYSTVPSQNDPVCTKLKYSLMCPPHGPFALLLFICLAVLLGFGLIISALGNDGLPGGQFFGLYVLFLVCVLAGHLVTYIRLPPLLGMLVVGVILGNVPVINVARDITPGWSASLRKIALGVILTRAGLGLDPKALKRMSCVVIRLAFLPCLVEAIVCMVASHFILGLDWIWGLMLGFVLAAVSPAVIVPSLLSLSERGYGLDKGIPTLVIAAASIDDVLAISAFSICLGIAFSGTSNLVFDILKGPLEALTGVVYGFLLGLVLWYLPSDQTKHRDMKRSVLLLATGLLALFGSSAAHIDGAGALGCLTVAFVAALRWRVNEEQLPSEVHMGFLWTIFQPLLFGLIGASVNLSAIEDFGTIIGLGIAVLVIGLVFRLLASFLAVFGTDFNMKEKLFIPLAWLPKATVQALIGSLAYDKANQSANSTERQRTMGLQILTVAVLCILITAPIGAAAISISGPRLLNKSNSATSPNITNNGGMVDLDYRLEDEVESGGGDKVESEGRV